MNTLSPLRYPGGKSSMTGLLQQVRRINGLGALAVAEPFAGGAGASLNLLNLEETSDVYINDADPAIHDIWWGILEKSKEFNGLIQSTRVSMAEWERQRRYYRSSARPSRLKRGFSAFYLNRCNRSGIIMNGGPIGGTKQLGKWKLNARFNKPALQARCKRLHEYKDRIHLSCMDGVKFIDSMDSAKTMFFIDPPYFVKGELLYLNALDEAYHRSLADRLKAMQEATWILTYDDCPEIRKMYRGWAQIRPFSLRYAAAERRQGKEVLISPKWMKLPSTQSSAAIGW